MNFNHIYYTIIDFLCKVVYNTLDFKHFIKVPLKTSRIITTIIKEEHKWLLKLQCKEYIENKDADHFFDIRKLDIPGILQQPYLFPYTSGSSGLAHYKVYALLAEYVSQFRLTRERVYKSVFEEVYYTDENGNNLSCVIDDAQLECRPEILSVTIENDYALQELTYKELYTLATSKTISECDYFV